jgi:polyphosphate:AMP phosphotransferase
MMYQTHLLRDFQFQKSQMSSDEKKQAIKQQSARLGKLQMELQRSHLPVIVLVEGWGTSGKGSRIGSMIRDLDPRFFQVISLSAPSPEELAKPFLCRHIKNIPENGKILFLDSGWMDESVRAMENGQLSVTEYAHRLEEIRIFERQLCDNGYLLVKLFLHIDQKEQNKRIHHLMDNADTYWRVSEHDLWQNRHYERCRKDFDEFLQATSLPYAPWQIIDSSRRRQSELECLESLCSSIELALQKKAEQILPGSQNDPQYDPCQKQFPLLKMPALADIPLDQQMSRKEYKQQLRFYQKKLSRLHDQIYRWKIPVILAYEGWDAAGKGGNIKRITGALDPRGYQVIPIAAPKPYELARHYLWRFWQHLPKKGHIVIFDRTWYGRVMVERLEGFCSEHDWQRAYTEINEFEQQLSDWGAVILKFWVQIDKETQLKRFEERQNTPEKQWKITDEDWRNREKWDEYEGAVNQMLQKTSTSYAPWHIIESNCKYYARIKTLRLLTEALEAAVEQAQKRSKQK